MQISKKWPNLALGTLGLLIILVSSYLTHHYFSLLFPTDLNVGSFCDISRFWNCDNAALSPFGNILNVPTSIFGIIFGLIILFGALINKASVTKTNGFIALINLIGCVILLGYSLSFLQGLCPGCTIYYFLSLLTALIFFALRPGLRRPKLSILAAYGVFTVLIWGATFAYNFERFKKQDLAIAKWVKRLRQEARENDLDFGFELPLVKSTENFADAPLRITLFSDFQCQYCKILSNNLEKLAPKYQGKINIQYMFFPLDSACNDEMDSSKHPFACQAARLSYCGRRDFASIHDAIYASQDDLSEEWILQKADALDLRACYDSDESKARVKELVKKSDRLKIEGAPFMLINGHRISGLIPARALIALLDDLLKEQE